MAGVSISLSGEQHLTRLAAQQFARAMALEPGDCGLKPNSNTPRADRPEQLQNGLQTWYRSECLIKGVSRESILTLVRHGKNLSFLLPAVCGGSEVAGTELAALTDFLGSEPLRILQYRFQRLRLLLCSVEVCLPLLFYASGDQGGASSARTPGRSGRKERCRDPERALPGSLACAGRPTMCR